MEQTKVQNVSREKSEALLLDWLADRLWLQHERGKPLGWDPQTQRSIISNLRTFASIHLVKIICSRSLPLVYLGYRRILSAVGHRIYSKLSKQSNNLHHVTLRSEPTVTLSENWSVYQTLVRPLEYLIHSVLVSGSLTSFNLKIILQQGIPLFHHLLSSTVGLWKTYPVYAPF